MWNHGFEHVDSSGILIMTLFFSLYPMDKSEDNELLCVTWFPLELSNSDFISILSTQNQATMTELSQQKGTLSSTKLIWGTSPADV